MSLSLIFAKEKNSNKLKHSKRQTRHFPGFRRSWFCRSSRSLHRYRLCLLEEKSSECTTHLDTFVLDFTVVELLAFREVGRDVVGSAKNIKIKKSFCILRPALYNERTDNGIFELLWSSLVIWVSFAVVLPVAVVILVVVVGTGISWVFFWIFHFCPDITGRISTFSAVASN